MPYLSIGNGDPHQTITAPNNYIVEFVKFAVNPEVTFVGPGTYNLDIKASLLSSYTLQATDGAVLNVTSTDELLTSVNLVIEGASTISFDEQFSAASAISANFSGSGGTLVLPPALDEVGDRSTTVTGFGAGDHIDFGSAIASGDKVIYTSKGPGSDTGTLKLENANGKVLGSVTLFGNYTQSDFYVATAANGTGEIDFACFLRGTQVLTPAGEVSVETLQAGDQVMTLTNGPATVLAVRLRSFAAGATSPKILPVCIAVGALAYNVPHRALYVSPDHSLLLDGALVPAQLLINGESITQPRRTSAIDYFHVEIAPHDVIIAEGAASESYLDIGNRNHFDTPGVVSLLPAADPKSWEDACAPLLLAGPQLARIQSGLRARAAVPARRATAA